MTGVLTSHTEETQGEEEKARSWRERVEPHSHNQGTCGASRLWKQQGRILTSIPEETWPC